MEKYCEQCGKPLTNEKHICKECKKLNKRLYARKHYAEQKEKGIVKVRYGITTCSICGKEIIKNRPNQTICYDCYKATKHKTVENYNKVARTNTSRTIGRQTILNLGINLSKNMCVHHLDENPSNNKIENLLIINRKNHAHLHRFLEKNWSLLLKNNSSNLENCWNILRNQLTTTWLETMGVKVIKITDIGQSAAEPLNEDLIYKFSNEEGSETMYQASKSITQDEDIVQTQNTNN